jgi:hypothetical protein
MPLVVEQGSPVEIPRVFSGYPGLYRFALRHGLSVALFGGIGFLLIQVLRRGQGALTYALDDAYLHMGLARHLVQEGVWGVGDGFASATSSILWPAALAVVYWIKGPDLYTPLVFELLGVLALLVWTTSMVRSNFPSLDRRGWPAGAAFLAVGLAAPITTLVFTGLEHIWHLVGLLAVVDCGTRILAAESTASSQRRATRRLLLLAPLLTVVRYETLALVPVLAALFLMRRRWWAALAVVGGSVVPVVIFGWWSQSMGGYFWPNSVLLKVTRHAPGQDLLTQAEAVIEHLLRLAPMHPAYFTLLALSLLSFAWVTSATRTWWSRPGLWLGLFVVQALAHAIFGDFGWLFRYEGYVLAFGVAANLFALAWIYDRGGLPSRWTHSGLGPGRRVHLVGIVALVCALSYFLADRTRDATLLTPRASGNIFEQQIQTSRFLQRFYPQASVALNDIGAASYFTDIQLLDLVGLGSNAVAKARIDGRFTDQLIAHLAVERDLDLAIVYESWFETNGGLPRSWIKVGEWEIRDPVISSPVVSFFAVDPPQADALERNLKLFASDLPPQVIQRVVR